MVFVGLMEGHLTAFQNKSVFICGTDHFSFIYVDHFPEIVSFSVVAEILGQLHIEYRYDLIYIDHFIKTHACKIIFHGGTPLSDFIIIIADFTLHVQLFGDKIFTNDLVMYIIAGKSGNCPNP